MKKLLLEDKFNFSLICGTILIFCVSNYHILNIFSISSEDEIGYLASAALLAGYNWEECISAFTPYFSYGVGIFYSVAFHLFKDPIIIYRCILIINSLFLCIAFIISVKSFEIIGGKREIKLIVAGLIAICYPSNIFYSYGALSENCTTLFFWIIIFLALKCIHHKKIIYQIGFLIACIGIYVVHQRNLGILLSGILFLILFNVRYVYKRSIVQNLILLGIFLFILALVHKIFKTYIKTNLWSYGQYSELNDYSQYTWLAELFSLEVIIMLLRGVAGKLWYILIATLGTVFVSLTFLAKFLLARIKNYKSCKARDLFYLFLLMCFMANFAIYSISLVNPGRVDHIIMGRYTEAILGPYIFLGILLILKRKECFNVWWYIVIAGLFGKIAEIYAEEIAEKKGAFTAVGSISGVSAFWGNTIYENGIILKVTALGMAGILIVFYFIIKNKYLMFFLLLLASFSINTAKSYDFVIKGAQEINENMVVPICSYIRSEGNGNEIILGFDPKNYYIRQIQVMLYDYTFCLMDKENIEKCDNVDYFIISEENREEYTQIYSLEEPVLKFKWCYVYEAQG